MRQALLIALTTLFLGPAGYAREADLARIFLPGRAVLDADGDGFPEKPAVTIVVPDRPTSHELALAADIAARVNFESLALDLGLVRRESEVRGRRDLPGLILVGGRLALAREALKERGGPAAGALAAHQGLVFAFELKGQSGVACVAGSDETLLRTGRAFFLRWPYFWEIWGREARATYDALEEDLDKFLAEANARPSRTAVKEALYEFTVPPAAADSLQALAFDQGQVRDLTVEVHFADDGRKARALDALTALRSQKRKGIRTDVLSYPGCAGLSLVLRGRNASSRVELPRVGSTKRLLTPGFKDRPATEPAGKEFDLLGVFSTKAVYSDQDRDGIPDGLDTTVVIPAALPAVGSATLASRLVLDTAGASFPIVRLDTEVEHRKSLAAPILVGPNALTADLVKTGKLKLPELGPAEGLLKIVPKAFGTSSALVVHAPDEAGLEGILAYLGRTFPHFEEFGDGHPQLGDAAADMEKFLKGGKGAAASPS